jgi:hypothetical protein
MIPGAPGRFRRHSLEPQPRQIQLIDKYIDNPHRVILRNVIVENFWEQRALTSIFAFDKSLHQSLPILGRRRSYVSKIIGVFTHIWTHPLLQDEASVILL